MNVSLKEIPNIIIRHNTFSIMSALLMGGGLCHAVDQKQYTYIPLVVLMPSVYAGYHIYNNKYAVKKYLMQTYGRSP